MNNSSLSPQVKSTTFSQNQRIRKGELLALSTLGVQARIVTVCTSIKVLWLAQRHQLSDSAFLEAYRREPELARKFGYAKNSWFTPAIQSAGDIKLRAKQLLLELMNGQGVDYFVANNNRINSADVLQQANQWLYSEWLNKRIPLTSEISIYGAQVDENRDYPANFQLIDCRAINGATVSIIKGSISAGDNARVRACGSEAVAIAAGKTSQAYAEVPGAQAYASGSKSKAFASAFTKAYACTSGATAYACDTQARAYTLVPGSSACASAEGAVAFADAPQSRAYALKYGANAHARVPHSQAEATGDGAAASARSINSLALATAEGAMAYACVFGAKAKAKANQAVAAAEVTGSVASACVNGSIAKAYLAGAEANALADGAKAIGYTHGSLVQAKVSGATAIANSNGVELSSNVAGTILIANAEGAVANADGAGVTALANADGSLASANYSGASASAIAGGALALANCNGASASACVYGAVARAVKGGAEACAFSEGAVANADVNGAKADANADGAVAYANAAGARAYANSAGSMALATAAEAVALAMVTGAVAVQVADGAEVIHFASAGFNPQLLEFVNSRKLTQPSEISQMRNILSRIPVNSTLSHSGIKISIPRNSPLDLAPLTNKYRIVFKPTKQSIWQDPDHENKIYIIKQNGQSEFYLLHANELVQLRLRALAAIEWQKFSPGASIAVDELVKLFASEILEQDSQTEYCAIRNSLSLSEEQDSVYELFKLSELIALLKYAYFPRNPLTRKLIHTSDILLGQPFLAWLSNFEDIQLELPELNATNLKAKPSGSLNAF